MSHVINRQLPYMTNILCCTCCRIHTANFNAIRAAKKLSCSKKGRGWRSYQSWAVWNLYEFQICSHGALSSLWMLPKNGISEGYKTSSQKGCLLPSGQSLWGRETRGMMAWKGKREVMWIQSAVIGLIGVCCLGWGKAHITRALSLCLLYEH